jgi:putative transposase
LARPLRIEFPGAIYHVTSRGIARQDIVADDRDRDDRTGKRGQAIFLV